MVAGAGLVVGADTTVVDGVVAKEVEVPAVTLGAGVVVGVKLDAGLVLALVDALGVVTAGVVFVEIAVATGVVLLAAVVLLGAEALVAGTAATVTAGVALTAMAGVVGVVVLPPTTTVLGAAPVYQGAKPSPCRYSIFCHTMESQLGLVTRPPVSPELAFHANQKKLVIGLCSASTGVPSA